MNTEYTKEVAAIIKSQISTSTKMACGAHDYAYGESEGMAYLSFKVVISRSQRHFIKVLLNGSDLYNVELIHLRGGKIQKTTLKDVFVEDLNELIYSLCNKR